MPSITWSEEDKEDPYPAVLEAIGMAFAFGWASGGIGKGPEEDALGEMQDECQRVVAHFDEDSLPVIEGRG